MTPKYPIKAFDGTTTSDIQVLNVPAGAIDANGEIDLGLGNPVPKVYRALLTQTGTDAPVATVLENTLGGTVVWARGDVGVYNATLAGAFTANKTFATVAPTFTFSTDVLSQNLVEVTSASVCTLNVRQIEFQADPITGNNVDDGLVNTPIEILVYP